MKFLKGTLMLKKAVAVAAISATSLFLYQMPGQLAVHTPNGAALGDVVSRTSGKTIPEAVAASIQKAPILEIHIANNGSVFLRGARVVSVSEEAIRVATAWEEVGFTWKIQINFYTKFLKSRSEEQAFEDIHVGDLVNVTGDLVSGGAEPVIKAHFIREE